MSWASEWNIIQDISAVSAAQGWITQIHVPLILDPILPFWPGIHQKSTTEKADLQSKADYRTSVLYQHAWSALKGCTGILNMFFIGIGLIVFGLILHTFMLFLISRCMCQTPQHTIYVSVQGHTDSLYWDQRQADSAYVDRDFVSLTVHALKSSQTSKIWDTVQYESVLH